MRRVVHFYGSTVGKKVAMAASGAVLFFWIIAHMLGNLKTFQGPEHINAYAEGLRTFGGPFFGPGQVLWLIRLVRSARGRSPVGPGWTCLSGTHSDRPGASHTPPHLE